MTKLISILLALTCATLHAQSVIVKGTGAGAVHRSGTGAGSVRGVVVMPATYTNYSDGRFTVWNTNQDVVIDNDSGIMWTKSASIGGKMDWTNAADYCDALSTNGHSDWRLPSIAEFSRDRDAGVGSSTGLVDSYPSVNTPALPLGHPFINVQSSDIGYWSSTEYSGVDGWYLLVTDGLAVNFPKTDLFYIWPCRGP